MNLWRLEWLRLVRTKRWLILVGVYGFFAVLGPFAARYMQDIIGRFGGDIEVTVPDPRPVDGLLQFLSNASQLGLLAVLIVAAGALALDARPEIAAFYRTREQRLTRLILPRYAVVTAAAVGALAAGTGITWALTAILIGGLPAGDVVVGTLLGAVYLAFTVALVAAATAVIRSTVAAVFAAVAALLAVPAFGLVGALEPWLPSELLGAVIDLVLGAPVTDFVRPLAVALLLSAGLVGLAIWRLGHREI